MAYKILRLDDYGRGITKVDDKICFVNNALEDEEVEISIINGKSKFMEADSKELNNISINRQHVKGPYYLACGGCNIAHMKYDKQLFALSEEAYFKMYLLSNNKDVVQKQKQLLKMLLEDFKEELKKATNIHDDILRIKIEKNQ